METVRLSVVALIEALNPTIGGCEIDFLCARIADTEGGCKLESIRSEKCIGEHDGVGIPLNKPDFHRLINMK